MAPPRSVAFNGPVSSLRFAEGARGGRLLLAGVGRALHVHDTADGSLVCAKAVLREAWLHAIDACAAPRDDGHLVLVSGGRELALMHVRRDAPVRALWHARCPAWILEATLDAPPADADGGTARGASALVRVGFINNRLELWSVALGGTIDAVVPAADGSGAPCAALVASCLLYTSPSPRD